MNKGKMSWLGLFLITIFFLRGLSSLSSKFSSNWSYTRLFIIKYRNNAKCSKNQQLNYGSTEVLEIEIYPILLDLCYQQLMNKAMAKQKLAKIQKVDININLQEYWESFAKFLPQFLNTPITLINFLIGVLNNTLVFILYCILVGQTIHILNTSERRYINLRHLLIKWVFLILILILSDYIKQHTVLDEIFALLCNIFAMLMVYPSKFIKNLHLKYFSFSEKKKYDDSMDDPSLYQMNLITRILVSLTIFCLHWSRFMITFIAPIHRKKIEEGMRGVNMVIVQEKYFWKIYDTTWSGGNAHESMVLPTMTSMAKAIDSKESNKSPQRTARSNKDSIIKAKVSEYIQILMSSNPSTPNNRKFTFYRNIDLIYNIDTSQLVIISQEDAKSTTHILAQLVVIDELMLQFVCDSQEEPVYVKFKNKKQMELFMNSIYLES